MVWTPPFSTGIEVPEWRCNPTTSERERQHERYDDWDRFCNNSLKQLCIELSPTAKTRSSSAQLRLRALQKHEEKARLLAIRPLI